MAVWNHGGNGPLTDAHFALIHVQHNLPIRMFSHGLHQPFNIPGTSGETGDADGGAVSNKNLPIRLADDPLDSPTP